MPKSRVSLWTLPVSIKFTNKKTLANWSAFCRVALNIVSHENMKGIVLFHLLSSLNINYTPFPSKHVCVYLEAEWMNRGNSIFQVGRPHTELAYLSLKHFFWWFWDCLVDKLISSFFPRLSFNWRTFLRRVTKRWWRGWAKNQVWTNQNSSSN